MKLSLGLHTLIEGEATRANAHGIILQVCSSDGQIDFKGSVGGAAPDARLAIASITKIFTAALITQLADERALSLDQTVQSSRSEVSTRPTHPRPNRLYVADA